MNTLKILLATLLGLVISISSQGQILMPTVIANGGGHHQDPNSGNQLSWTIGQVAVLTQTNFTGDIMVTEGFQQPESPCTTVINTNDTGYGSLRNAIICANLNPGIDTIRFNLGGTIPYTINLASPLPILTDGATHIIGETQEGFEPGSIVVDGTMVNADGGLLINTSDVVISGLEFANFSVLPAININASNEALISNCDFVNNSVAVQVSGMSEQIWITENRFLCNTTAIDLQDNSNSSNLRMTPMVEQTNAEAIWGQAQPFDTIEVYWFDPSECGGVDCQGKELLGKTQATASGFWVLEQDFTSLENFETVALGYDQNGNSTEFSNCAKICPTLFESFTDTICIGGEYAFGGEIYISSGIYYDTTQVVGDVCDSITELNLFVLDPNDLPPAIAFDSLSCTGTGVLAAADLPDYIEGFWTSADPEVLILEDSSILTEIQDLQPGENVIQWTVTNKFCPDYDSTFITVFFFDETPIAMDDELQLNLEDRMATINVLENDDFASNPGYYSWSTTVLSVDPPDQVVVPESAGVYFLEFDGSAPSIQFTYLLENINCPDYRDEALVTLLFQTDETFDEERAFSPNGDGINDFFVFPELEDFPNNFENNELIVFNRWGDIVFQEGPYSNTWDGTNQATGQSLPAGTYYYILRLDLGNGEVKQGQITLVR